MKIQKYLFLKFNNYKKRELNINDYLFVLSSILFGFVDPVTTYIGIEYFNAVESNPIILYLINSFGIIPALFISKLIALIIYFYLFYHTMYHYESLFSKLSLYQIRFIISLTFLFMAFFIVLLNSYQIFNSIFSISMFLYM